MSDKSAIEWTEATWNPITGCAKISVGCKHCYAERFAERFRGTPGHPYEQGFDVRLHPERLIQVHDWRRPRKIFVGSMTDIFQDAVPTVYLDQIFAAMYGADHHIYQILTKRPARMARYLQSRWLAPGGWVPRHIHIGTSIENQDVAGRRIESLRNAPGALRFLSIEPLLGPVDLNDMLDGIGWVIVGGESGPKARPMEADWARGVRDACATAAVPFFFKQWGGLRPKSGGRLLDGVEHNALPRLRR